MVHKSVSGSVSPSGTSRAPQQLGLAQDPQADVLVLRARATSAYIPLLGKSWFAVAPRKLPFLNPQPSEREREGGRERERGAREIEGGSEGGSDISRVTETRTDTDRHIDRDRQRRRTDKDVYMSFQTDLRTHMHMYVHM